MIRKPWRLFGVRVTLAMIASMAIVVILSDSLIYKFTVKSQFEDLRTRLKTIAQTAAIMINAEYLQQIPLTRQGVNTQAYAIISDQLKKIKAANPQIEYIYILTRTDAGKAWKFIVDLDVIPVAGRATVAGSVPGTPYDASRFSEMLKGFEAPSADRKLETDEWGTTLSGYAPIRDSLGKPIAVLGVDMDARDIYIMESEIRKRSMIILLAGILFSIVLGIIVSRRVTGPIHQLKTGIKYINEGNLHHQVQVVGDDEIAQLAKAFNDMAKGLHESRQKLLSYFYDTAKSLVMLLEARDHYTLGHSEAVAYYAEKMALRMGINPKTIDYFKRVVLLHDIGKVGVRDSILLKPGKLDENEWESIKLHPVLGEQILKPILNDPQMLSIVRNHHERYDGKGYPDGWSREQIPLLVAIVTVADSYDAMTSTRPYRCAMTREQAIEQLVAHRGTQFHPDVVEIFLEILKAEVIHVAP
ncbi:MAG: HD domain-containing protein [Candidatus Omnitrophica bacterium]|nr:HD domain-containing protein [Candidatus Omnitrophota bacterium]